jgi:hypothetical protein
MLVLGAAQVSVDEAVLEVASAWVEASAADPVAATALGAVSEAAQVLVAA